ncbi:hypothetical protein DID77_02310 [Candidatus Marinamargulisbacteria bacterium SCGC AG-439-L15]|nr:hypothetical protein DID77_02310 [Candidatus Marinamargulisbacteria bacterium SCGC AG-439-L15]
MEKVKLILVVISLCVGISSPMHSDSLWHGSTQSLYNPTRVPRIGDIITIRISAQSTAVSSAGTKTSKKSGVEANFYDLNDQFSQTGGSDTSRFLKNYRVGAGDRYQGVGQTSRKSKVKAIISAIVTEVMANGNLVIIGDHSVRINDETEVIRISGTIRPQDIDSDNSVPSHKIASVKVSVKGNGVVSSKQTPGVLTKMFNWVF